MSRTKPFAALAGLTRWYVRQPNGEHEQALVRVVLASFLSAYVIWQIPLSEISSKLMWTMVIFLVVSISLLVHLAFFRQPMPIRRLIGIVNDAGGITFGMLYAGELGVPIYLFYLWITFGNGFRFGRRYLYAALVASLIGFSAVLLTVDYWQQHRSLGLGLWLGMILVGMYFSTLVARLTKALQHEEAVNQAKRRFISSVSHELRTPLNAIIGMANLLQSTALNREQEDMVRSLDNASHLMLALIEDVLDFSKIEAGKLLIEDIELDLHRLVSSTMDIFKYQAAARGLELRVQIDPEAPFDLRGDPAHLRQVLVNLISNAVKFTEKGHVLLRIHCVSNSGMKVRLRFEVEDSGIGIAVDAQSKVFESFTQADDSTSRRYGGTGLGTTISRELVELMGGKLGLRSEVGVGSTFWFELDLQKQAAHSEVACVDSPIDLHTAQLLEPVEDAATVDHNSARDAVAYHILVAEDNPINRAVIQKMLERAGHLCHLVDNGEEALDIMEHQHFDAVIVDMNMPVMNGVEATRALRVLESPGFHIPVIMLSADVTADTKAEALAAGVDQFLPKPIQITLLLECLDRLIAQYGRRPPRVAVPFLLPDLAPQQPATEAGAVLNYTTLAELEAIGRNRQFVDDLINGFIEDAQGLMLRCEQALMRHHHEEFKNLLHAIKGSAMSIGATLLRVNCERLEELPTGVIDTDTVAIRDELQRTFAQVCDALDTYRQRRSEAIAQHS